MRITSLPENTFPEPADMFGFEDISANLTMRVSFENMKYAFMFMPTDLNSGSSNTWQFDPYTPVATNFDIDDGSMDGWYWIIGDATFFQLTITWGAGSTGTGEFILSLPDDWTDGVPEQKIADLVVWDISAPDKPYMGVAVFHEDGDKMRLKINTVDGSYITLSDVDDATPITLAVGDVITIAGWYARAS